MMMLRGLYRCKKGAAAAEMALILPFALLLVYAGLEAGHYMFQRHQVVKGLRDGARYAARNPFDSINCRSGGATGTIDSTLAGMVKNVTRTGKLSGGNARVGNWADSDITVSVLCPTVAASPTSQSGIYEAAEPAPIVQVSTSFNYSSFFNGLGVLDDTALLSAHQQATVMGI